MNLLCMVPSRAGSKRLAAKNMALLGGRPLLAWTVEAALGSGSFEEVFVSTEDEATALFAGKMGADVSIRRPLELAGDEVTNVAVSLHLLDRLAETGRTFDAIVCLQPSSPLRNAADIAGAIAEFESSGCDFLVSTTPIDPHYCHWALGERSNGTWGMVFEEKYLTVRQNLPEFRRPNGAIKIAKVDALRAVGNFFGPSLATYAMPESRSVHVATAEDLRLCEFYLH